MSARWLIALAALVATPAAAQDASELADRFERALVAGDYRGLPLAEDFTYTENGSRLNPWDGMWRTLTAVEGAVDFPELDYRVELVDGDTAVRVVEFTENTVQGVMAYRLVAREGQIVSVDLLPIREEFGGDRGGTLTLLQPMLPVTMDGELVGPAPALYAEEDGLEGSQAEYLSSQVSTYFSAIEDLVAVERENDDGVVEIEWPVLASNCERMDNGRAVTGVADGPLLDLSQPLFRPYALDCHGQLASGFYSNFRLGSLTMTADETRGLVIAFARLDQPGTVLSFTDMEGIEITYPVPRGAVEGGNTSEQFDGRILSNMLTPMSVNGVYLFKFNSDGEVERIEAFYRGAPLGWDAVPD